MTITRKQLREAYIVRIMNERHTTRQDAKARAKGFWERVFQGDIGNIRPGVHPRFFAVLTELHITSAEAIRIIRTGRPVRKSE